MLHPYWATFKALNYLEKAVMDDVWRRVRDQTVSPCVPGQGSTQDRECHPGDVNSLIELL